MKTLLITGGSGGIGAEIVRLFAARGWNVAFTYRKNLAGAKSLSAETGALAICADSAKEEDVVSAVRQTLSAFGKVDCLINNAAIAGFSLFTDITYEQWQEFLSVNLTGAFLYSREVLRDMLHRHDGKIINISSMWGETGASCEVHYSTTKAGLIGMTRALAKEVGPSGITVNAIAPGVVDTPMNRALSEDDIAVLREDTPLGRIGTPRDIAEAAWFLAGDGASFITGEVLNVNGGFLI